MTDVALGSFDVLDLAEVYFTMSSRDVGCLVEPLQASATVRNVKHGGRGWIVTIRAAGGEGVVVCDAYARSLDNVQWLLDLASTRLGMSQIPFVFDPV